MITDLDLAILKIGEAELLLNRRLAKKTNGQDEDVNDLLIQLTKVKIQLENIQSQVQIDRDVQVKCDGSCSGVVDHELPFVGTD